MDPNEMMWTDIIKEYRSELMMLAILCLLVITLLIALPQLLRANMRKAEMLHLERLKSIEKGIPLPIDDDRSRLACRTAMLVPMMVMIAAATVTSFLVVYKSESLFPVALSVWVVAGVVSLTALTGGVALIGRLAHLQAGKEEEEEEDLSQSSYMN